MRITYRGDALNIYSAKEPTCKGVEVENAHFEIEDAIGNTTCFDGIDVSTLMALYNVCPVPSEVQSNILDKR